MQSVKSVVLIVVLTARVSACTSEPRERDPGQIEARQSSTTTVDGLSGTRVPTAAAPVAGAAPSLPALAETVPDVVSSTSEPAGQAAAWVLAALNPADARLVAVYRSDDGAGHVVVVSVDGRVESYTVERRVDGWSWTGTIDPTGDHLPEPADGAV